MAVASSPASKSNLKKQKLKQQQKIDCSNKEAKRTKNQGVRVIHGRIYDSQNGKTCHQCRQKTMDFAAGCKNQKKNKPCPLKFCHTCLLNRYGEKATEVEILDDWSCPRCRDICNCSICMKKRGRQPTGILLHTAKATGCSSVSELLHVKGPENLGLGKDGTVDDIGASPKKLAVSEKEAVTASRRKRGKENSFEGRIDMNLHPLPLPPNPVDRRPKKLKQEGSGKIQDVNLDNGSLPKKSNPCFDEKKSKEIKRGGLKKMNAVEGDGVTFLEETCLHANEKKSKKLKSEELKEMHDGDIANCGLREGSLKKLQVSNKTYNKEVKPNRKVAGVFEEGKGYTANVCEKIPLDPYINSKKYRNRKNKSQNDVENNRNTQNGGARETHKDNRKPLQSQSRDLDADVLLPKGTELGTVAGVELALKDVGNALQFLEFCAAFGKILSLTKGQPRVILQELLHGRSRRRGCYSIVVQFHIQLLSLLQKEFGAVHQALSPTHGKNSWLQALKNCVSNSHSQYALSSLPLDCLDREAGGYDTLDASTKLSLLNFLCDEVLETARIRIWIDEQNSKFAEKAKEAKERVLAAKDKEKRLRQKMLNDVAEAIIAKNGAPLSISEHDALVCQIKSEAAQAHEEMLKSMGMVPKKKQRSDAVRTEPILLGDNGCAYWKLKGFPGKPNILLQDVGTGDATSLDEKWFAFDDEQEKMIEKHISINMKRRRKAPTVPEINSSRSPEINA